MRTTSVMTLAVVALGAAPALADIPPPSTYVETCTIAQKLTATSECLECSAYYGDTTRCSKLLNTYCYQSLCKTWGASAWSEVLCRTKAANAPVVPSDVIAILSSSTKPAPSADGGTIPASCAPYTPPTGTATTTVTATATKSETATQTPTETKTATDTKSSTATASSTATVTVTQTAVITQSATSTQSNTQSSTVATSTGTQTSTSPNKPSDDSSGCSVTTGKSAVRALGPLSVLLAGLALLALGRRRRR